jgi:hypothetical protein
VPLWQLAENPTRYVGLNVNVTGFIDDVYDTYFYLADLEDKYSIIIFYNKIDISLFIGQKACVLGVFLFDEETLRYKIEINQESHGIFLPQERRYLLVGVCIGYIFLHSWCFSRHSYWLIAWFTCK